MVVLLIVGLVGGWVLAGRMLAPLDRITEAARLTISGSLAHRIRLEGRDDEFRELADAFDAMLGWLEAHVAEQQRFAANASHELRTPLAITQALLEVAAQDPARDSEQLVSRLQRVNARAIDLSEALLVLSRANQRPVASEPVDLSLVAEEATEALLPLAERRGVALRSDTTPTSTAGSHALLVQLATNLVHNAIVHNAWSDDQPRDRSVWVTTGVDDAGARLMVANTGEHLAPEIIATLTEPFRRGSERIRTDDEGVGLGLAIVRSITDAHGGTLTLAPRPDGGMTATVLLPAAHDR